MGKPIVHLRWRRHGSIPSYAQAYYKKYGRRRSLCWLAPSTKKIMTDTINNVTCKRCLASIKKLGLK